MMEVSSNVKHPKILRQDESPTRRDAQTTTYYLVIPKYTSYIGGDLGWGDIGSC